MSDSADVTALLRECSRGDKSALDKLVALVYPELRRRAGQLLRGQRPNHTFQPTALVNELWLRLVRGRPVDWEGRSHFLGFAAKAMRNILADYGRRRKARGGDPVLLDSNIAANGSPLDVTGIDEALSALAQFDPRKSEMLELRYFGGFTMEEIASYVGLDVANVRRNMRLAEAWLARKLALPEKTGGEL